MSEKKPQHRGRVSVNKAEIHGNLRATQLSLWSLTPVVVALSGGAGAAQTAATPDCYQATGGVACTISAGDYSLPVSESVGALSVDTYGSFSILAADPYTYAVSFQSQGLNGANSSTGRAGPAMAVRPAMFRSRRMMRAL